MSFSIPQNYVEQFSSRVHQLAEQRVSRLMGRVMMEGVTGESWAIERAGSVEANIIGDLHGDTPLNNTPHSRRWGYIKGYDVADLLDKESQVKLLIDPMSTYTLKHAGAMGRAMDEEIIRAATGPAAQGKNGEQQVALPSTQQFNATGTGTTMSIADLRTAKARLDRAEVNPMMRRTCVLDASGFQQLLATTEITSSDFNTVKALVQGEINTYMGFDFVRTELITGANTAAAKGLFFSEEGIRLGMAKGVSSATDPRPDKRRSQQIYTDGWWGAVRVEDVQVVEVTYDATVTP